MPIILAIQEAEIRRITVHKTLSRKNSSQKRKREVQSVGPEFKPQHHKKKNLLQCHSL
jgi:hypothetical protein